MKMLLHIGASAASGFTIYKLIGIPNTAISLFLSGIFIDIDHIIDYFILSNKRFTLNNFFSHCYRGIQEKYYLFLHSYEIFAVLAFVACWTKNDCISGIMMGIGIHLIMDLIGNRNISSSKRLSPWFYFLSYRYVIAFNGNILLLNR